MQPDQARRLLLSATVLLLGVTAFAFREQLALAPGDFLVVEDELQPADVIHVIAGDDYRTAHAIRLYQQGYARQIFFTGGWCSEHQYYHGAHGVELAMRWGVPEEALAADETPVTSTYSELLRLKAYLDELEEAETPVRSVIVVSDPYHMRRTRWAFRHVLGRDIRLQMAPVPFEQTPYQRRWWTDQASKHYVEEEYLKLGYYIARYQLGWGPLQEWLASLDTE